MVAKKAKTSSAKKKSAPKAKKAAARAADTAKAAKSDAVKPSEVKKLPPAKTVKDLATLVIETQSKIGTHAGNVSDAIRAAKSKGLHPQAFKLAVKLKTQGANNVRKVSDFLDHLEYCLDVLGVTKMIEDQPELPVAKDEPEPAPVKAEAAPARAGGATKAAPSIAPTPVPAATYPLDDNTVVRPNFTQPEAETHIKEAAKLN